MKKKMISMLLALTLVVTGLPTGMTTEVVNAAELSEKSAVLSEETEDAIESNAVYASELHSEAGDLYTFNVSENGKAIGSDGVVYEDVAYLSADTVKALNADAQNAYFEFCDEIADARKTGSDLKDVVVAVDENGTLAFQYSIPVKALEAAMEELAENLTEAGETETTVEQTVEADTAVNAETEEDTDAEETATAKEASTEESVLTEEAVSTEEVSMEETEAEETEVSTEESETEETTASAEEAATETEEFATEEAVSTEEVSMEETETEASTEEDSEEFVLSAENMELISELEAEEFPVVEPAKAELKLDLGYGSSSKIQQADSILPSSDWFSSQLSANQKKIYNACKGMLKGTNKFTFEATSKLTYADFCQAVSAHIMTNPYQCDWMDLSSTGEFNVKYYYYTLSDPTFKWEVTVGKSKYYNAALVKEANAKVLELAEAAQAYAAEKYPTTPVFGIVKYFDKWICDNNYYNMVGVEGGDSKVAEIQEIYYYCHSSYGILLKGYGVCESYALAMTRLLDAIGIPNMYATGQALDENGNPLGGHAWNYIQMPDGKWYLQDSTWNDDDKTGTSSELWLLCFDDGMHFPMGNRYKSYTDIFEFVTRSNTYYEPTVEKITLSKTEINLLPKKTEEITFSNTYIENENVPKVWSSSDEKVAKVDKNGKVTAIAPGSAVITLTAAGMTAKCTVNVHQINSLTFDDGGKTSLTASCGIDGSTKETQHILLTVNQKAEKPAYTAEQLVAKGVFDDFKAASSDTAVATVDYAVNGNKIDLAIKPVAMGKTKITVTFGTKKATLTFSVSEKLDKNWFDLTEVDKLVNGTNPYTGKAYKPKVVLTDAGKAKKVKFKVTYKNNKDAGTAEVIITGTGSFGGSIIKEFEIQPLPLNVDTASLKISKPSNVYNGGANQTKSTVKNINTVDGKTKKTGLKAGKDYDIEYTKEKVTTTEPTEVGKYTMKIVGKGNYTGTYAVPDTTYEITKNDISKVKVAVKIDKAAPTKPVVEVKIGKNVLPSTDYKMTFYSDKDCTKSVSSFSAKTQYFVKVEAAGSNITDLKNKPIVKSFKTK